MATVSAPGPRSKPARSVRLPRRPGEGRLGILDIIVGELLTSYFLTLVPSDFGSGFRLEKFSIQGGEVYHVNLADDGKHTCECKGFLHRSTCRHVEGLLALCRAGRL